MAKIYYIGGSPCSGKSTIAEMIAKEHNLYYFKVDDYLEEYISKGKQKGKQASTKISTMTPEEIWMRPPEEQSDEELEIYREMFEFIMNDLKEINVPNGIITEGAAYLPELVKMAGIDSRHYINIVPTKEFQYSHYKERPFVPYVLEGCSDKTAAFENWMERDVLFAVFVREQAEQLGYESVVTTGELSIQKTYNIVCQIFGLEV